MECKIKQKEVKVVGSITTQCLSRPSRKHRWYSCLPRSNRCQASVALSRRWSLIHFVVAKKEELNVQGLIVLNISKNALIVAYTEMGGFCPIDRGWPIG